MILFRGLALLTFWYTIYVMEPPFFFTIHEYAEEHCAFTQSMLVNYCDYYLEHPLYFAVLAVYGFLLYLLGKIFDSTLGIFSVLGISAIACYVIFYR